ncbi:hypothetical protein [Roseovarius salis]|uniref:hypothetical protein n=1 Tax=Roseovarius salis TaxID=3376063 RepID=UPI0037C76B02
MALCRIIPSLLAAALAGCGPFPEVDTAEQSDAPAASYPALMPVETLRAAASRPPAGDTRTRVAAAGEPAPAAGMNDRAARLRARAARLRGGAVLDKDDKKRLGKSVDIGENGD